MAAAALAASLAAAPVPAAVIVTFNEVGNDVVGSFSGGLDLSYPIGRAIVSHPYLQPDAGQFYSPGNSQYAWIDVFLASGFAFSAGGFNPGAIGDAADGDAFDVDYGATGVPAGYVSGPALAGTFTFLSQSFAMMNIFPGTYTYTLWNQDTAAYDGDTVTLQFNTASAVPLPATLPLLLGRLGVAAVTGWWLKRDNEIG